MRYAIALAGIAALTLLGVPAYGAPAHAAPLVTTIGPYGYAVTGSTYTSTTADWTMPTLKCTTSGASVSIWTGLDGYSSPTVEQIGAEAVCESGTAEYSGWYDLYPAAPVYFSNTISPGDAMTASVVFSGTTTFKFTLQDVTAGWSHAVTKNAAGEERSSAEVVTEGPGAAGVLTDFGKITFTGCEVNSLSLGDQDPTPITMVDGSGKVMVSTSAITAAGKFVNTWLRGT